MSVAENRVEQNDIVAMRTKLAFGVGATAEAAVNVGFNAFNFFFYNQILGLSGTLAGLAVTIALICDAITDPLIGVLSDRLKSKLGRRHPFMFAAPLPVAYCFYSIYTPPDVLQGFWLFVWFTIFTVLLRSFLTLFAVPHLAMGAELSKDYNQRSIVMSYNNFFGWIGGAGTHILGLTVFFAATPEFSYGLLDKEAYPRFGIFVALVTIILILASAWFTRDQIPRLSQPPDDQAGFRFSEIFSEMLGALKNRNYLSLMLGLFFLSAMLGTRETLGNHVSTFFWEITSEQIVWYNLASLIGYVSAFVLTARYHVMFDKRPTILGSLIVMCIFSALPILLRILGLFPENHSVMLMPLLVFLAIFGYHGGAVLNISVMSALADIADEHELTTSRRQEGVFYAARTFFAKAISGMGHLIAGIFIDVIEFPTGAAPGTVDESKVFWLGMMDGPLAVIPGFVAAAFYAGYRINKKRHAEIQEELAARKLATTEQSG
jgi:Na+/melibiose symporter-like transporter|tara:strand:+ start:4150 stop:5619 length:1470 start_codon:yes stop_codon:yes gene_type:complete